MANRTVNISMIHHAALAGMESAIASSFDVDICDYHDHLIYTAMVQSGVKKFRVIGGLSKQIRESEFLSERCEEYQFDKYHQVIDRVSKTFYDTSLDRVESKSHDLIPLSLFISDIIFALETKSAMVSVFGIPDLSEYHGRLRLDQTAILSSLINAVNQVELATPVPKWEILSKDVSIFEEIITSDLFSSYSSSHALLELPSENTSLVVKDIKDKGKALTNKFSRYLDIQGMATSLIPITTSIIDTFFGKIPGLIAEAFGKKLEDLIDGNKRITIYDYGKSHRNLLIAHYKRLKFCRNDTSQQ